MAGAVAAVVASAVVNVVAFSGSNCIFTNIDKSIATDDVKRRHDTKDKYNREKDAYKEHLRLQK